MRVALVVAVPTAGLQEPARTAVVWEAPTQVAVEEGQPLSAPVVLEVQAVWVPRAIWLGRRSCTDPVLAVAHGLIKVLVDLVLAQVARMGSPLQQVL